MNAYSDTVSKRRNKPQEQALPIPAIKAVPVYGRVQNSLYGKVCPGSRTAMTDTAHLLQCCYHGHHLPGCLLKNMTAASVVR